MCVIKQINSANEDVPPQWCYLWYMQALEKLDLMVDRSRVKKTVYRTDTELACRYVLWNKMERLTNTLLPAHPEFNS